MVVSIPDDGRHCNVCRVLCPDLSIKRGLRVKKLAGNNQRQHAAAKKAGRNVQRQCIQSC